MTRTALGLTALVLVPAWLGSWPMTLLAILLALFLALMIGSWAGSGPLPPRMASPRRGRRWRLGVGLGVPVGPILAFVTLWRRR